MQWRSVYFNLFFLDTAVVFVPYIGYHIIANPIHYFPSMSLLLLKSKAAQKITTQ